MGTQRRFHRKNIAPFDPDAKPIKEWHPANRACFDRFQRWLRRTGCGDSTVRIYGVAARWALGWLDQPHWLIDPDTDLQRAAAHIEPLCQSPATWDSYRKGLNKFAEFLRLIHGLAQPEKPLDWDGYLQTLAPAMQADVRSFLHHLCRSWPAAKQREHTLQTLGRLTRCLRWAAGVQGVADPEGLHPAIWNSYLDTRLADGLSPSTLNTELTLLKQFLWFLFEEGRPINERLFKLRPLPRKHHLPKDVDVADLQKLLAQLELERQHPRPVKQRLAVMDTAWVLLMLHCGLRTMEVRDLQLAAIHWEAKSLRLEQSKGLKDRIVYLSEAVMAALQEWLAIRGDPELLPGLLFLFWQRPLSKTYCLERLRTLSLEGGLRSRIRPHQLRHSFATLLLNAGAPVETVQLLLGHERIQTTMGYARVYDGTAAADYFQAMRLVESRLEPPGKTPAPSIAEMLMLVEALRTGNLNEKQIETLQTLHEGLRVLCER